MKIINGYRLFENTDEAVYMAKSKEDVYDYFVENYGSTEDCQGQTKEQFINELIEISLDSDSANRVRSWISDDTEEVYQTSYYDEYKSAATKNNGVSVIACLAW